MKFFILHCTGLDIKYDILSCIAHECEVDLSDECMGGAKQKIRCWISLSSSVSEKEMFCDIACNPTFCEVFDNSTKLYKMWLVHMEFYVCDMDSAVGLSP
jgi:hypothetical protein